MPQNARSKSSAVIHTLIVVDDMLLQAAIERRLKHEGHIAASANGSREAIERLRRELFDVVLCDLHTTSGDGAELLQWLGSYFPSVPVVLIVEALSPEFRGQYEGGGSVRIVEKPIDLDKLVNAIEACGVRKGFYGNQIEVEFFDYVQMVAGSGRDKAVVLTTHAGTGYLWIEHGDIVHAQWGEIRGEQAFYKMLSVGRGSFRENLFRSPPVRTIVRSSMHLLMEAARQADEGILGQSDETVEEREDEKPRAAPPPPEPELTPPPRPVAEVRTSTRAPMPKPATSPPRSAPPSPPSSPSYGGSGLRRASDIRPDDIDMASVADSAIARIDDLALPQDDDEIEARSHRPPPRAPERSSSERSGERSPSERSGERSPSERSGERSPEPSNDGVPVLRRRVQTLERRVAQPATPTPSRGTPTSVPALRATPASIPVRATPASIPAVPARATPTSIPAVRTTTIPPGQSSAPARNAPPPRADARPIKKANTVDLLEDPETRELMLGQFWQFEGVNGVAIISSTGKVIAEDMRNNSTVVTLAGFYMRGAARIARTLGYHVFDGVIARSASGQQMIMVGMGATSAVLSIAPGHDPEAIRDAIMGVDTKR
ncbi:response regulator [Nannocystis bainbridge]|uniref:Response regulator n=1 Tax=Nannocystis bainbridge TaxID=2995303 RepID=A0ABT5ECJ9_9BACT|nr:response regulator [Nannocystis bainbridge]MDC0722582.1 response regulator [Nannocystis bainbridge]